MSIRGKRLPNTLQNVHYAEIKEYADYLRLTNLRNNAESIIHQAQIDSPTYMELIHKIVYQEVKQRQQGDLDKRRKLAKLLTIGYNFTN